MFTGIVKDLGVIESIRGGRVTVRTGLEGVSPGDSVMVDGVCLTAGSVAPGKVRMDIGRETLSRTSLGNLRSGSKVNIEDALTLSSRVGGHLVYGHVMETGRVMSLRRSSNTLLMRIRASRGFLSKIFPKGSVAVNGVSLTVNTVRKDFFEVGIIPETLQRTNLGLLKVSGRVNLEADLLLAAAGS